MPLPQPPPPPPPVHSREKKKKNHKPKSPIFFLNPNQTKSPITELGFSEEDSVGVGLISEREVDLRRMGLIGGKPKQWFDRHWVSVKMKD